MRILIRRALVLDPASTHHKKRLDILVRNGTIERIGRSLTDKASHTVESDNLHVSVGWVDTGTQVGEPGLEHREDLESVSRAAIAGGYTRLICFPNTDPALHSKSEVEYIRNRSRSLPVDVLPVGAISRNCKGVDIAEMQDMHNAGAVAFSDGRNPVGDSGLMLRALQYVKTFGGLIVNRPYDRHLSPHGQVHESRTSVRMGMPGIPGMAERMMLERDLRLLEYAGSRLLSYGVSTSTAISLIRSARKSGLAVHATVPAVNLLLRDEDVEAFDTNLKVMPPLRGRTDRNALIRGIRDGTITCICTNHEPIEEERKKLEFAHAAFGSTGLETAFAMACTALKGKVKIEDIVRCFAIGPREVFDLPVPRIIQNESAELTLFDPDVSWTVSAGDLRSRSRNCAAMGQTLKGKVIGVITKGVLRQ